MKMNIMPAALVALLKGQAYLYLRPTHNYPKTENTLYEASATSAIEKTL